MAEKELNYDKMIKAVESHGTKKLMSREEFDMISKYVENSFRWDETHRPSVAHSMQKIEMFNERYGFGRKPAEIASDYEVTDKVVDRCTKNVRECYRYLYWFYKKYGESLLELGQYLLEIMHENGIHTKDELLKFVDESGDLHKMHYSYMKQYLSDDMVESIMEFLRNDENN